MVDIAERLQTVQEQLRNAEERAGRPSGSLQLVAVTKTFPPETVRRAVEAGQRCFGENRVQEAEEKIQALADLDLEWHLIGPLQSNKAGRAVQLFDVIETLDRPKIVRRVARCAEEDGKLLRVFIQVNIGGENQKSGVAPEKLEDLIALVEEFPSLQLQGFMTIPPFEEDPEKTRPYFRKMAELLERVNSRRETPLAELSMGMSGDFSVAVEEGATLVRVGTAIFGQRS